MALPLLQLALLFLPLLIPKSSQALSLLGPTTLTHTSPANTTTTTTTNAGTRVPGRSPFIYVGDPTNNLFQIASLEMNPNPCTLRSSCTLSARGVFTQDIATPRLRANITSDFAGEPVTIFLIEDDFCAWVDVEQDRRKSCPPKRGPAVLRYDAVLMQGWIPEATYGIDIEVTAENGAMVSHVYADLQLREPDLTSS